MNEKYVISICITKDNKNNKIFMVTLQELHATY